MKHYISWDEHIETICKNVGAGVGPSLKRIKPYIPANMLQSIYNALFTTLYFDYCSPHAFWGILEQNTQKDKLQKFQRAARIIII